MPLFALTGWAFFLLLEGVQGRVAAIAKVAACLYAVLAIGYESAVGLGSGIVTDAVLGESLSEQRVIERVLSKVILSGLFDRLAVLISLAGILSIVCSIVALWRAGAPRWALLIFTGSLCFALAHESPLGPLGNFFFFAGSLLLEIFWTPGDYPIRGEVFPSMTI